MSAKENVRTGSIGLGRVFLAVPLALIACCCITAGCKKASAPSTPARMEDPATRGLRAIGDRVTTAIVAKDVNALLEYDHDPEDAASLQSKSGDLYCYLFDSSCIPGAKTRAVYDLFSNSRQLAIDASTAKIQDAQYGLLMFYDKSQVSEADLYSQDFLCSDKARRTTASWHFVLTNGKWTSTTLFDYKVDSPCKR